VTDTATDSVPQEAAHARVANLAGDELELASLWRERPAVVAWLRHFG
jgi:hypothetical protein